MAHSSRWIEDQQGNCDEDATRTDPRDWIGEKDVDSEGGLVAIQYLRCPECGGMASETRNRYECEECGHESYVLERDGKY